MSAWSQPLALPVAYAVATAAWWGARRLWPRLWPPRTDFVPPRPGVELAWAALGVAGVVGAGRLWSLGLLLPEAGPWSTAAAAANQVLIFLPLLVVPVVRRHDRASCWVPPGHLGARLAVGAGLALVALAAWCAVRPDDHGLAATLAGVLRPRHGDEAVQVLLEDVAVAILFVRIAALTGTRAAMAGVAVLFAAAHVPPLLAAGAGAGDLALLAGDVGLVILVLATLRHARDVVWFWPVHLVLDLTQFPGVSGVP